MQRLETCLLSWQSFVASCDVLNCLFLLDVQNEIQLLSRLFCNSWLVCLLRFLLTNAPFVKVIGNPTSDGIVFKNELTQGLFIWARLTGLARFPRSRLTSKSFVKVSICSYERAGWLGSRDLGKRAGSFCHMNTSSRLLGWMAGWILAVQMASSGIACYIFHIISIPLNCSDTVLRVTDGKIGPER